MKEGRLTSAFKRFVMSGGLNITLGLVMAGGGIAGAVTGHPADAGLIALSGSQFAVVPIVRGQRKTP